MTPTEIIILNFISVLIGIFIGNRFAIDRDKRREFNSLIDPIRHDLLIIRNHPQSEISGEYMITFAHIREKLRFWKKRGFDRAIENYHKNKNAYNHSLQSDGMGGRINGDKTAEYGSVISHSVKTLLKYLKHK